MFSNSNSIDFTETLWFIDFELILWNSKEEFKMRIFLPY
jgi:hypothetical protein